MYKRILIATDGTAHSVSAILEATAMAQKYGSELYLLHVLGSFVTMDPLGGSSVVITQQLQESTRKFLKTFKGLAAEDGIMNFTTIVRRGELFYRTILQEAVSRQVDLIMIGRRKSSLKKHLLLQSLTSQLLFYTPCPVLIVPLAAMIQWQNIILVIRAAAPAEAALTQTLKIAQEYGTKTITLIIAARRPQAAEVYRKINERFQALAAQAGVALATMPKPARDADEIASLAKKQAADIIVISQTKENILKHIFLGSLAERITDRSLCSVLVLPSGPAPTNKPAPVML